jgi:hypothetical protein
MLGPNITLSVAAYCSILQHDKERKVITKFLYIKISLKAISE